MGLTPLERQKRQYEKKCKEWDALPKIPCACGCGTMIRPITRRGEPAKYAPGHSPNIGLPSRFQPGHPTWNKGMKNPPGSGFNKGKKLSADEIARRTATRKANYGGVYQIKKGWKHSPETREHMNQAAKLRAPKYAGAGNPFYGKKHPPEIMARIAAQHTGPLHPNWNGGCSALPYGPEFTRRFKRLILERDHHTCQRCGKTRAQNGRSMQVHHIDHDKMNNDPINLVTVCNSCNVWLSYHRDEPFQRITPIRQEQNDNNP